MNKKSIVVFFFLLVLFSQLLLAGIGPFWKTVENNPLHDAHICAAKFKTATGDEPRVGFFYMQPQPGFTLSDPRIGAQVRLQAVMAPQILDHRPDQIENYAWVIGYFINEKMAGSDAAKAGLAYHLEVSQVCGNYVLFKRGSG